MSRTYRRFVVTAGYTGIHRKRAKSAANRKIRYMSPEVEIPQHSGYKKVYSSWDICDYKFNYIHHKEVHKEWWYTFHSAKVHKYGNRVWG